MVDRAAAAVLARVMDRAAAAVLARVVDAAAAAVHARRMHQAPFAQARAEAAELAHPIA